jgi:hypothetical protein
MGIVGGIARDRGPDHHPLVVERPRMAAVQHTSVVLNNDVALGPGMFVSPWRDAGVVAQLLKKASAGCFVFANNVTGVSPDIEISPARNGVSTDDRMRHGRKPIEVQTTRPTA